jgi:small subunit ribosomal protein S8
MDPIAQMLNEVKNAQTVGKETVGLPFSRFKHEVARILAENGFIEKTEKKGRGVKKILEIVLKEKPGLSGFKKISKPSQKIYLPCKKLKARQGLVIVSTGRGLMTSRQARKEKLGGEVICEVW